MVLRIDESPMGVRVSALEGAADRSGVEATIVGTSSVVNSKVGLSGVASSMPRLSRVDSMVGAFNVVSVK